MPPILDEQVYVELLLDYKEAAYAAAFAMGRIHNPEHQTIREPRNLWQVKNQSPCAVSPSLPLPRLLSARRTPPVPHPSMLSSDMVPAPPVVEAVAERPSHLALLSLRLPKPAVSSRSLVSWTAVELLI